MAGGWASLGLLDELVEERSLVGVGGLPGLEGLAPLLVCVRVLLRLEDLVGVGGDL